MAIMIVDSDCRSRNVIKHCFKKISNEIVFECRNIRDSIQILDLKKNKFNIIIYNADEEFKRNNKILCSSHNFISELIKRPSLNSIPLLCLSSDPSKEMTENDRVDFILIKPFGADLLEYAINQGFENRIKHRNKLLFLGKSAPDELIRACETGLNGSPCSVACVSNVRALDDVTLNSSESIGSILLNPVDFNQLDKIKIFKILRRFQRSSLGRDVPIICLSREVEEVFYFRSLCIAYLQSSHGIEFWTDVLSQLRRNLESKWMIVQLLSNVRKLLESDASKTAHKAAARALSLDPLNGHVHTQLGEVLARLNKFELASNHFERAISINPCFPRPYLQLMKLAHRQNLKLETSLGSMAQQYCSNISMTLE